MRALPTLLSKIPLFPRVVSLHIVGWMLLILIPQILPKTTPPVAAFPPVQKIVKVQSAVGERIIRGEPIAFHVKRLGINLSIVDGTYDQKTDKWTLTDDAVQFAEMTTLPNDRSGNTFLYGHNTQKVLMPMSNIVPGDIVTIDTANGYTFTYAYTKDAIIPPDMTSVLYDNPAQPRLTVMTCEGIWSQARRLMYFDLKEVS